MSGFFGIFNRNGRPVDKSIANTMLDAASYWNPDEREVWTEGQIALGHTMLWNTPESKYEHLPLKKENLILTMDARIDNREELSKEIELPDRPMEEIGDSEFILGAYKKWGKECPNHLLGDFAFAIWDAEKKQLFCARDHVGIKSLYYYLSDDLFVFSNDIEVMLSNAHVPKTLDDNTVAIFLKSEGVFTKKSTFFLEIKKLPPASTLSVKAAKKQEQQYWTLESSPKITLENYDEYVSRLRELYHKAIDARLRTEYGVSSHMSGGIDSSPIAVLASRKLKKRNQKLHTFNWVVMPESDQRYESESWSFSTHISDCEENIVHEEFCQDAHEILQQYLEHNIFTKGTMYYTEEYAVQSRVGELSSRVLLSGWGGDELISHNSFTYLKGLLKQKKYYLFFKYVWIEKEYLDFPLKNFTKTIIRKALPSRLINSIRKNRITEKNIYRCKECLVPSFGSFFDKHKVEEFNNMAGVRERHFMFFDLGHLQERIESWSLSSFSKRFEYRYPLLDKRIIEFAVGIPEELFYPKQGSTRHLIKSSVQDLLPENICWTEKVDENHVESTRYQKFVHMMRLIQSGKVDIFDGEANGYLNCRKIYDTIANTDFDAIKEWTKPLPEALILFASSLKNLKEKGYDK